MDRFDEVGRDGLLEAGLLLEPLEVGTAVLNQQLRRLGLVGAVLHVDVELGRLGNKYIYCTKKKNVDKNY